MPKSRWPRTLFAMIALALVAGACGSRQSHEEIRAAAARGSRTIADDRALGLASSQEGQIGAGAATDAGQAPGRDVGGSDGLVNPAGVGGQGSTGARSGQSAGG